MYKSAVAAFMLSVTQISYGAEALLTGQAQVLSTPDYVEISIVVDSKCYSTPSDAREFTDEASRRIVDFLNTKIKKKDVYNAVISKGGYTSPYQNYYRDKLLCQNTFQKQNTIIFRTQDLKNFESLFNEIQNTVYKEFKRNLPPIIQSSISYVVISEPAPGVSNKLHSELEQKAMAMAYDDAKSKLFSLFGQNGIQNLKMIYASELPPEEPKPLYQNRAPMAMMGARMEKGAEVPVQFDEQKIEKTLYFKFSFDDVFIKNN